MTAQARTVVHCDRPGCDQIAYGRSAAVVREGAQASGWRVNVEGWGRTRHDYCPEHA